MKKFLLTISLALLFLCGGVVHAEITQGITGIVKDKVTGETLPGADITFDKDVSSERGHDGVGTITNMEGVYEEELEPGTYYMVVSSVGYYDSEQMEIAIQGGKIITKDFLLETKSTTLDEIVIQGYKSDPTKSGDIVTAGTGLSIEQLPKYLVGVAHYRKDGKKLKGDATDVTFWLQRFIRKFSSIIAAVAVFFIIWNAFGLVTAAGNADNISKSKKAITWVIIALALVIFAYILVKTVISLVYLA